MQWGRLNAALIEAGLTLLVMLLTFLLGVVFAKPSERDWQRRWVVLRYGRTFIGMGMLLTLFWGVVCIVFIFMWPQNDKDGWMGYIVFPALLLSSFAMLIEGNRRLVTLDDAGIWIRGWTGTQKPIAWKDIGRIENKPSSGKYFVSASGAKCSVSHYLDRTDWFAEECLRRLNPSVYGQIFRAFGVQNGQ